MIESRAGFYGFLAIFVASCAAYLRIAYTVIRKILHRRTMVVAMCLLLSGCASLTYRAPDGTTVTYSRFMTGSDTIKGTLPGASIESRGQKAIDPAILELIIGLLTAAR